MLCLMMTDWKAQLETFDSLLFVLFSGLIEGGSVDCVPSSSPSSTTLPVMGLDEG